MLPNRSCEGLDMLFKEQGKDLEVPSTGLIVLVF